MKFLIFSVLLLSSAKAFGHDDGVLLDRKSRELAYEKVERAGFNSDNQKVSFSLETTYYKLIPKSESPDGGFDVDSRVFTTACFKAEEQGEGVVRIGHTYYNHNEGTSVDTRSKYEKGDVESVCRNTPNPMQVAWEQEKETEAENN